MAEGSTSSRILSLFQVIFANLVTNVTSVTFDFSLIEISWLFVNNMIPNPSVDVVNDVVKFDSTVRQIGGSVWIARILSCDLLFHFNFG